MVELREVEKRYGEKVVLEKVNLEIEAGEFVAMRGESGAGKTTLLNLISGLEKPTKGEIMVDGKMVGGLKARERTEFYRHEVGIVFQGSYLLSQFSLLENIELPGVFAGMTMKERKRRAEELAQRLGIEGNLKFLPTEVSGGQAERACIARALLLKPKIVLADEPTSNLDEKNAEMVLAILEEIRKEMGVTIFVASHNRETLRWATRILTIQDGKVQSEVG